jgi:hypothetical protein
MARRGHAWCDVARHGLAWWMARPLLSTSPLCVFSPSPLRAVLRPLCRRLLNVLVLGPDAAWLALCLGLWPLRLWVFLSCRGTHAAHSRVSGNPTLGPRLRGDERLVSILRRFLFSASFRKNPHCDDHEGCRRQNKMAEFRPNRRTAPIGEDGRNDGDRARNISLDVIRHAIATAV